MIHSITKDGVIDIRSEQSNCYHTRQKSLNFCITTETLTWEAKIVNKETLIILILVVIVDLLIFYR